MKRGYWLAGIVIVLIGAAAALFLPSYFAKQGMDRLIASLPAGTQLTYGKAKYSLLSRTFTLDGAVLHLADPAITVEAEEIAVQNGNPWLEKAIEKAEANPANNSAATRIADVITVKNIHTSYLSMDLKIALSRVDNPKLYLGELYSPLPPIKTDTGALATLAGGASFGLMLQKAAQHNLALAFDKQEVRDTTIAINQAKSSMNLVAQIADMETIGYDRGSQQGTTITNVTLGGTMTPGNAIEVSVEKMGLGPCDYREIFSKLRDGNSFQTAFENFTTLHETIDKIAIKRNGANFLSIAAISFDGSGNAGINSVKSDINTIVLSLPPSAQTGLFSFLPQLGYAPAIFDASLSYQQDPATGLLSFSDSKLVMENGGTIAMDGSMIGPTADAPTQMKLAGFTLTYIDDSLATRLLDYSAKKSGRSVDQIKQFYIQYLQAYETAHADEPVIISGAEALKTFIANPHQLTLSVHPQQPIGRDDLAGIDPQTITKMMGLSLTAQ